MILEQIVDIVSGMNMPEVIGAYATKMFKVYLKRFGNERMLHSPWSVTAAAVYAGMLMHEHVICQPFARTRDEVCKVAEKYRRASNFLGRSSCRNRMVRLKRVYEYTKRFQDLGLISKDISIPPLSMLNDVKKRKDVANQCRRWAIFNGCKDHTMYLSSSKSWGIDLEMRQGILTVVDIEPGLTAWKAGFQIHDMIVSTRSTSIQKQSTYRRCVSTCTDTQTKTPHDQSTRQTSHEECTGQPYESDINAEHNGKTGTHGSIQKLLIYLPNIPSLPGICAISSKTDIGLNITPPSLPLYENQIDTNYGPHLYKMSNRYVKTTPFHGKAYSLVKATMNKAHKKTFVSWEDIAMDEDKEKVDRCMHPLKGDDRC